MDRNAIVNSMNHRHFHMQIQNSNFFFGSNGGYLKVFFFRTKNGNVIVFDMTVSLGKGD